MDVVFDFWSGESIDQVIQNIAEFRIQVLGDTENIQHSLSSEINFLQHYFSNDASIIVANDCGSIVGYISCISFSDFHSELIEFSHFGDDLKISEGPLVHLNYRNMGIGKGLVQEAINHCESNDASLFIIDPIKIMRPENKLAIYTIMKNFNFKEISEKFIFQKELFN